VDEVNVGDQVRYAGRKWTVIGIDGTDLWLKDDAGNRVIENESNVKPFVSDVPIQATLLAFRTPPLAPVVVASLNAGLTTPSVIAIVRVWTGQDGEDKVRLERV
jgi:hypothetical protein